MDEKTERVLELTGAQSVAQLAGYFAGMSEEETLDALNEMFPTEDSEQLAQDIVDVLEV